MEMVEEGQLCNAGHTVVPVSGWRKQPVRDYNYAEDDRWFRLTQDDDLPWPTTDTEVEPAAAVATVAAAAIKRRVQPYLIPAPAPAPAAAAAPAAAEDTAATRVRERVPHVEEWPWEKSPLELHEEAMQLRNSVLEAMHEASQEHKEAEKKARAQRNHDLNQGLRFQAAAEAEARFSQAGGGFRESDPDEITVGDLGQATELGAVQAVADALPPSSAEAEPPALDLPERPKAGAPGTLLYKQKKQGELSCIIQVYQFQRVHRTATRYQYQYKPIHSITHPLRNPSSVNLSKP